MLPRPQHIVAFLTKFPSGQRRQIDLVLLVLFLSYASVKANILRFQTENVDKEDNIDEIKAHKKYENSTSAQSLYV